MRHPAIFDMAARLNHLEPADLPQRARGATNGVFASPMLFSEEPATWMIL